MPTRQILEVHASSMLRWRGTIPDEIAETQYQNAHARELYYASQIRLEVLDEVRKHRCQSQWTHALRKGHCRGAGHCGNFPEPTPVL